MAKGLRSKVKKTFRTLKREVVKQAPWQLKAEEQRQEALKKVLAAPKPEPPSPAEGDDDAAGPVKMDADAPLNDDIPEVTAQNAGKVLRKLKARRLAAARGVVPGKKKKANPLAGANQFHKKKKKR